MTQHFHTRFVSFQRVTPNLELEPELRTVGLERHPFKLKHGRSPNVLKSMILGNVRRFRFTDFCSIPAHSGSTEGRPGMRREAAKAPDFACTARMALTRRTLGYPCPKALILLTPSGLFRLHADTARMSVKPHPIEVAARARRGVPSPAGRSRERCPGSASPPSPAWR